MAKNPNKEQMSASDHNLILLETDKLEQHLDASIKMGTNVGIFGRRGSGKTEIAKQRIKENKCKELYLNLSMLERVDFSGYPRIFSAKESDFVSFILPEFFKDLVSEDPNAPDVVALLDEVDKAPHDLNAPLLEFTQFKSINGRKLPKLRAVIMTGNLIAEGGQRPSLPLLDRTEKYIINPSVEKWLNWAGKTNSIHPSIVAYIADNNNSLYGALNTEDNYADPSPRGWFNASKILKEGEELNLPTDILLKKVSGCVGKQIGMQYEMYYNYYQKLLPLVDKIFTKTKAKKEFQDMMKQYNSLNPSEKFVALMITCSRFSNNLDKLVSVNKTAAQLQKEGKTPDYILSVGEFISQDSVQIENVLVAIRSQITADRFQHHSLDEFPVWDKTLDKIHVSLNGSST